MQDGEAATGLREAGEGSAGEQEGNQHELAKEAEPEEERCHEQEGPQREHQRWGRRCED